MDNSEYNYITFRVLLSYYLSESNIYLSLKYYDIIQPESEPSSLSSLLFLTFDELKLIHEYCGLIRYKGSQILMIVDQITYGIDHC